jgi:hypothetical protein
LSEVAKTGENESPEIEVLRNVILALLYGLINILNGPIKLIAIEIDNGPKVIKTTNMIIAQLGQMSNSNRQILNDLIQPHLLI